MRINTFRSKTEAIYAYRLVDLIRKPFNKWEAYDLGIIDADGNVLKRSLLPRERVKWSRFHSAVAEVKKMLSRGPERKSEMQLLWQKYRTIREEFLPDADMSILESEFPMLQEMVSGDAGGNAENIAAGKNSGAVVYPGPGGFKKKKKVKKMAEMVDFKQFVEQKKADELEALRIAEEAANVVIEPVSVTLKAFGMNSVFVESVGNEVTNVVVTGKTSRDNLVEADIKEAFKEHGQDGVLAYVKEATKLVWKVVVS
ncbi:MAG: hypothetical protein ACRDCE_00320 [Cetobacterium sp.]|uniref:hypothetical protein n=1 Tax=Cetobacterium sp. TaxID=2071632 RepID=UPI003EE57185